MNATTREQLDLATADIMAHTASLNEITCEKFRATAEFLATIIFSEPDEELVLQLHRLVSMLTVMHLAKHKCQKIATLSPAEIMAFMHREILMDISSQ